MTPTDAALHCEARKWSYRQTKEGVVISFLLHPNELPDGLALAALGTRFMLAVCEIGDDEKPVNQKEKQPKSFKDMSFAQQAGMLCNDPSFQKFMKETTDFTHGDVPLMVRQFCGVESRKDILPGTSAATMWIALISDYRAWNLEAEIIG